MLSQMIKKQLLVVFVCFPFLTYALEDFIFLSNHKCGTHLLMQFIENITGLTWQQKYNNKPDISQEIQELKQNRLILWKHQINDEHFKYLQSKKYKFVFLYRDPRDQLISYIFWMPRVVKHAPICQIKDIHTQIRVLIEGSSTIKPLFSHKNFEQMKRVQRKNVLMVKFEDIVGSRGGGCDEKQLTTILKLAKFLGVPLPRAKVSEIIENTWGNRGTFRKGQIGDWKNYFTDEHIDLYKEKYGDKLIEMGYELDFNW